MHSNTIVKPRRLTQRAAPGPHHGKTAHGDPEPHEILAATTNHSLAPLPRFRPVPAAQHSAARRGARTLPLPLASRSTQQQTGRTKTAPPPSAPAPSRRRLFPPFPPPPFPGPPRPAFPSRASLSQIPPPHARVPFAARPISTPEFVVPGALFLAPICCASSPAAPEPAGDRVQLARSASAGVFAVRKVSIHLRSFLLCCPLQRCGLEVERRSVRASILSFDFAGFEIETALS